MATETGIFITLALFYMCLFTLMGTLPDESTVDFELGDEENSTGVLSVVEDNVDENLIESIVSFIQRIFSTMSGLPDIIQGLIFAPLTLFGVYWLIKFALNFIPFLGGSS